MHSIEENTLKTSPTRKLMLNTIIFLFRLATSLFIGFAFTIIGQNLIKYDKLVFYFLLVFFVMCFMRLSRKWGLLLLFCVNLTIIVLGFVIKLYIKTAPGW